jgi:restriction endonuclease-like protein
MPKAALSIKPIRDQCYAALAHGFRRSRPGIILNAEGYVEKPEDNLVPGVQPSDFEADLSAGAGGELKGKFLAAQSSAALAVNCFAPFRHGGWAFDLAPHTGLRVTGFERTFPTGLVRAPPPHVDVVSKGPTGLVAIESKCTEYLKPQPALFSERYETDITDERASGAWYAEMRRLKEPGNGGSRMLDAAQLIKHAFGLARHSCSRKTTLVYLYWQPLDADVSPVFAKHRAQIADLADRIAGGNTAFVSLSYGELWQAWAASGNVRLMAHVRNLRSRYAVAALGSEHPDHDPRPAAIAR